ncbi:cation channel sperm-associated auxiliary subunit epsilon [Carettochelys insculpta]|uniref:cation channel sperm-associated auxiliary subunit epsilon n=1 Tax=Carettochelys insculpta TaxID=44489 RepID=UPI003EB7CEFA
MGRSTVGSTLIPVSSIPSSQNDSQELILWVYDPENAEPSELNHTAVSPPPRESNHFFKLGSEHNLPETGIIGIQSRLWCSSEYPVQSGRKLSTVAIWTSSEQYLGYGGNVFIKITDTTELKKVLDLPVAASLSIGTVCYDSRPSEVALLMACIGCSSSRAFYLSSYNEDRDFKLPDGVKIVYRMNRKLFNPRRLKAKSKTSANLIMELQYVDDNYFGNSVIKMKNNIMYFLKVEMKDAVELPRWEKEDKSTVLYLNPSGNLYILFVNGSNIQREDYPLKTEVISSTLGFEGVCPYIVFKHSMNLNVYYLDMGDEVTFWAQIVYMENLGLSTDVEIYRPELLMQTTNVDYEQAHGICTKNQLTHLFVGCPPSRHIVIDRYDGSTFVKTVETNFILWEVHGRSDYSYKSTMKQVGCLREAQTWISMMKKHKNSSFDEIWGAQNYRSCFESERGPLGDLNQLYQMLNYSGYNYLIWPTEYSGIYVFRVKIVDPNFSFCDLSTIFAVRTYGIIESPNIGKVAGFSFLILSIFGGILVISYLRYVKIFRALSYVDPLLLHEQQDQITKSSRELKKDQ